MARISGGLASREVPIHLAVNERGLDRPEALHPPAAGDHISYQILFDSGAGLIGDLVITEHFLELLLIFAFQDNRTFRSNSMFQRITRCFFPSFGSFRAIRFGAVGSGRFRFQFRRHASSPDLSIYLTIP